MAINKNVTKTDTITTLPATIIGDGTPITSYTIKGNMEQNGTPTPSSPIYPSECGDLVTSGEHAGQYKLPITLGSTTTDIYLGEVQSTRRIKKLVLTGEEAWARSAIGSAVRVYTPQIIECMPLSPAICTHFNYSITNVQYPSVGEFVINTVKVIIFGVDKNTFVDVDTWKSYLAAQYANGTPVTIWYVLANPATGIVNEPIRKIGDYVDSISGTGLATSGTAQEFDVGTTLKPSEVDMTYHTWISTVPCRKYTKSRNSNSAWVDIPTYTRTDGAWVRDSDTWCYGFKVLKTSDDPDLKVEYLEDAVGMTPGSMGPTSFNFGSWLNAPFMPKACMLNFDGTVAYYLDPDDYTKKLDGTPSDVSNFDFNGNAMAEYGLLWYKFSDGDENTEFEFRVSNKKLDDDFVCHSNIDSNNDIIDHFYVPIYNGTTAPTYDSTVTYDVGAHVVYDGKEYRCKTAVSTAEAFDNSKWDLVSNTPRMRSLSGVQLTSANGNGQTSGTEEIARAEACNVGADKEWFIDMLCDHELITMLHVLVAKSLDCQAKFGQGISSGSQTAKEAYVTGSLDDKGSFYGSTSATTIAVKTFCRENFWALVWRRMAGLVGSSGNFLYKLTPNTADGSTATTYNTNGAGYLNGGARPASGYIKNLKRATETILPDTTSGSNVGTKDYYYDGNGYALVGGNSAAGALAGPFVFYLADGVSLRYWNLSGSPSCKPCKNKTL